MATSRASRNADIVRGAYEAFNEGDVESVLAVFDEDVEWVEPSGSPYHGTHRGHDAVMREVFARTGEEVEGFEADPERFIEDGDTLVVVGTDSGTYRSTGREFEAPFAHVIDMEDGQVVRFENHTDTHAWYEAAAE